MKKLKQWFGMILGKTSYAYNGKDVYKKGAKDELFKPIKGKDKKKFLAKSSGALKAMSIPKNDTLQKN
jgi:hypothetical protein